MIATDNSAVIARLERQNRELAEALREAEKDLVASQWNAREAAKIHDKWLGVSEAIQPTVDKCRSALANLDSEPCDSQNAESDTQQELCGTSERQGEQPAVPLAWEQAIDDEPELPDDMPEEMWQRMFKDKEHAKIALRATVRETKRGIKERMRSIASPEPDQPEAPKGDVQAMGNLHFEEDESYPRSILVTFDSDEDCRKAVMAGQCRYTVMGGRE